MRLRNDNFNMQVLVFCLVTAVGIVMSVNAHAAKAEAPKSTDSTIYTVKDGDYLGSIAIAHNTTVQAIIQANNLTAPDRINAGTELLIPTGEVVQAKKAPAKPKKKNITIKIPRGWSLSRIAKAYNISVASIMAANKKLKNADNIRHGQKLIIPGVDKEVELVPPPPCYAAPVEFYRVRNNETKKIVLTFCNGKVNPAGIKQLSEFSSPLNLDKMPFPLHPRLAIMLQKVANHYPGRRLEIVSGQRTRRNPGHESYHNKGQAIDFRVEGISNRKLSNYVRSTFDRTGVGYYPNSVFIHMDTREKSAFWIDYSGPGEKAIYGRASMSKKEVEAIRAKRAAKKTAKKAALAKAETKPVEEAPAAPATPVESKDDSAAIRQEMKAAIEKQLTTDEKAVATADEVAAPAQHQS